MAAPVLGAGISLVLNELQILTRDARPLLFRATVPASGQLPRILRKAGFIELRRVYEPELRLEALPPAAAEPAAPDLTLLSLPEALALASREELLRLFQEVCARTSRLDPATPGQIRTSEWEEVFLTDPQLQPEATTCAFVAGRLAGLASVFSGQDPLSFELGPFGVAGVWLDRHQEITLGMLHHSISVLRQAGALLLTAELDSDDPWVLYTLADLPFKPALSSISFAFVPAW